MSPPPSKPPRDPLRRPRPRPPYGPLGPARRPGEGGARTPVRFALLGPALRHLRLNFGPGPRQQREVAEAADVTRGMLSSYETSNQAPSLRTLERLLAALGADLADLQWALRIVEMAPAEALVDAEYEIGAVPGGEIAEPPAAYGEAAGMGVRTVAVPDPLTAREERALGQMIAGFLAWLRYTREDAEPDPTSPP